MGMKRIYGKFLLIIVLLLLITPSIVALENQQLLSKTDVDEFMSVFGIVSKVRRHTDYVSFHLIFAIAWGVEAFEHEGMPYIAFEYNQDYEMQKPLPGIIMFHLLFFHYD
jgi:hypothetical protein